MSQPEFSFEFSAPHTPEAYEKVLRIHARLASLEPAPSFFSVTYGAGGSTRASTRQAVIDLNRQSRTPVAAHLSFGADTRDTVRDLLHGYREAGVTRLVALRGDLPSGVGSSKQLIHANELVEFIRKETGDHFHVYVAAYPEMHPETASVADEIRYFKQKLDAGANAAITQYFYNVDAYFRYLDLSATAGVAAPIIPGIMPITNYKGLMRFSKQCGAEIPLWIKKPLADYQEDPAALAAFGDEVVTRLCERLLAGGAPGLHFYTMNQSLPVLRIWSALHP